MNPDQMIRAALLRAAELAPDEDRVRATLLHRAQWQRQRRTILIASAAAVAGATAIGVPTLLSRRDGRATHPNPLPSAYPTGTVPTDGNLRAALLLRPFWLPAGLGEAERGASIGDPQLRQGRVWLDRSSSTTQRRAVGLQIYPREPPTPSEATPSPVDQYAGEGNVTIGDRPGWLSGTGDGQGPASVEWLLTDDLIAAVYTSAMADSTEVALRVARSVGQESAAAVEVALGFDWLPAGIPGDRVTIAVHQQEYSPVQLLSLERYDLAYFPLVSVRLGRSQKAVADLVTGIDVTVRGRPGVCRYQDAFGSGSGQVVVQLADGRWLAVNVSGFDSPRLGRPDLLRIAEELRIGPDPDFSWIGAA